MHLIQLEVELPLSDRERVAALDRLHGGINEPRRLTFARSMSAKPTSANMFVPAPGATTPRAQQCGRMRKSVNRTAVTLVAIHGRQLGEPCVLQLILEPALGTGERIGRVEDRRHGGQRQILQVGYAPGPGLV